MKLSPVGEIIRLLEEQPENWFSAGYTLEYKGEGANTMSVWVANGFWFLHIYRPLQVRLSFFEKLRLNKAIKRWVADLLNSRRNKK